jgi:hypothetical protein
MRKAYMFGEPTTKLAVCETLKPGIVKLEIGGTAVELTESEFTELCGLQYYVKFAEEAQMSATAQTFATAQTSATTPIDTLS